MDSLLIQFKKKTDGTTVLHCLRPDGSATWQRRQGAFFVFHDFSHYAVETVLGLRYGFFGMLAEGWNITDFGTPWPRGPIPDYARTDALFAEALAGLLDTERAMGTPWSAADFNDRLTAPGAPMEHIDHPPLTDEALAQIRAAYDALVARWIGLGVDEPLERRFAVAAPKS